MKPFLSLLLAPALSLAAVSGTVTLLDGTPVTGAVIKNGSQSVTTSPNGVWSVASATGIASHPSKTISVTPHLALENGKPRLSFAGFDISGRPVASASVRNAIPQVAARSAASADTLSVYWKGKRLTVLPVPGDTGNITFKIDTAWKDDAGIPWNPRIAYGSLLDTRDGQTYRTVAIGRQTWMAENLNFAADSSWWYLGSPDSAKYGRLYRWAAALGLNDSCDTATCMVPWGRRMRGLCPEAWHVSSDPQWDTLVSLVDSNSTFIKSVDGWKNDTGSRSGGGNDLHGFRALPGGSRAVDGSSYGAGMASVWWTSSEAGAKASVYRLAYQGSLNLSIPRSMNDKRNARHIRCLKDTP